MAGVWWRPSPWGPTRSAWGPAFWGRRRRRSTTISKRKLVEASELDTQLIFRKFRNTARVFKNSVALEVAEIEKRPGTEFADVEELVAGERGEVVLDTGDLEHGIWWAGVSTGLIYDIPTVAELVSRIVSDAEKIINHRLRGLSQ